MNCFSGLQHGSWCRLRCWTGRWPPVFHVSWNLWLNGLMGISVATFDFQIAIKMSTHSFFLASAVDLCILYYISIHICISMRCAEWYDSGTRGCFGLRAIDLTGNMTPTGPPPADGLVWGQSCWLIDGPFMHSFDATCCLHIGVSGISWDQRGVPSWSLSWIIRLDRADSRGIFVEERKQVSCQSVSQGTVSPTPSGARVRGAQLFQVIPKIWSILMKKVSKGESNLVGSLEALLGCTLSSLPPVWRSTNWILFTEVCQARNGGL